ncbi:transcriptional regulator, BadM/Rrf2 family [Paenibacillus curdlanolyticus YK9]|uniref:Transcriptional regulator, BadM/Rrf2 family n=1 Tax=Paenibacillus curdlanolyticus YK9 TaxID=717606 RepID=E0IG58_9BACL|nr:Rrf2 family transcriptional regulator [Paenibacillus curdlanolyticus]EFM08638.1 transcriptional regulator, BadM/Rrf2 family [Paenibacillus curdlanolyticus YK9]
MNTTNRSIPGPPRFGIAVHALVWLSQSGCVVSSAMMAGQVNSHATFLRRIMVHLVQAGMVEAKEGRDGGYFLRKSPADITLADVYMAVKSDCGTEQASVAADDEGGCGAAGQQLDSVLESIMGQAEQHTIDYLRQFTVDDVMRQVDFTA